MRSLACLLIALALVGPRVARAAPARTAPAPTARPAPPPHPSQPPPRPSQPPPRRLASVEGITEYVLGNGLRVLMFPDPSKDTVTVNITYLVGSRMEGYGETGMAHLLEHMLFKGTPAHPKIWEELKQRGAQNNATTWYDRTNYFETLPAKNDNLAWALGLEADRMKNANIAAEELAKEFSVVRNEFEIGENRPDAVLSERMWSTAYLWHNYGKSTIGSRADIEKVPATSLKRFYQKYYRPDNAVLLVTGKLDPASTLATINQVYGALTNPATPIEPTYTTEPEQDGERVVTLRRNGDVQVVGLVYHVSAAGDPDFAAVDAMTEVLGAEPSGRLYTALVKTGMATSVYTSTLPLHDPGALEIQAVVPIGKSAEAVRDRMIAITEGLAKTKITDEELGRFKARSKRQFKQAMANSQRMGIAISEFIAAGDWRLWFLHRDAIAKLTTDDVQRAAATYLKSANRTLGMFVPTKTPDRAPLKRTPDIAKLTEGYQGAEAEAAGELFAATLDNIEARTKRSVLASGMKLAVLGKQTRGHIVRARLTMRYGVEADFTGAANRTAASALGRLIARGTKRHTFQQLQDQWDLHEAEVRFTSGPGVVDVDIQTTRAQLAEVLALVDEVLRQPTIPQDELAIVVKEALSDLDDQRSDPEAQALLAVSRAVAQYPALHPLYIPTTEEQIAGYRALRAGDVRKLAAMLGTSNATMSIVGDVDSAAIVPWVEKTWGAWRSPRPWKRLVRTYTATRGSDQLLDFGDKANAQIAVAHAVPVKDDDPDVPALKIANFSLGGGSFTSRLVARLRQQDGLSYKVYSYLRMPALDAAGAFTATAALNPENAKRGMAAMLEEIARTAASGITPAELKTAQQGVLLAFERDLANDAFVLGLLQDGLYLDRTLAFWSKQNAALAALTVEQVNAALRRYITPDTLFKITAGDKKKM